MSRSKSALLKRRRPGGHDARRPRPALYQLSIARRTTCLPDAARERAAQADRRGDRHALRRAGADGDPERPPLSARGATAARAPVSAAAEPGRACTSGAPRLAETIEWLIGVFAAQSPGYQDDLAAARLDPGRVRPLARDDPPLRAGRRLRLRLLQEPLALVLGHAAAPRLRPRRHPARRDARRGRPARARGRAAAARRARCAAARRSSATRATPAASSPRPSPRSAAPSCVRRAATNPATVHSSHRSGNGSNRSSSPAKTCSASNATAPAPRATSRPHRRRASSRSPPASASTTNSADPAAQSPTTPPNPVASII